MFQRNFLPVLILPFSLNIYAAESVVSRADDQQNQSAQTDPIQECLDKIRFNRVEKERRLAREAKAKAKKENGKAPSTPYTYSPVSAGDLPASCVNGNLEAFKSALREQIKNCEKPPLKEFAGPMKMGCRIVKREEWCLETNKKMLALAESAKDFGGFVESVKSEFDWFKSDGFIEDSSRFKKGQTQFTGYFGAGLEAVPPVNGGCPAKAPVAIYGTPKGLVELSPEQIADKNAYCGYDPLIKDKYKVCIKDGDKYERVPTRREINENGALKGRAPILACTDDPIGLSFLHLQGDGEVTLNGPGGSKQVKRFNYAAKNGGARNMVGSIAKCANPAFKAGSLSSIRDFLSKRKDMMKLLNYEDSYVFFKIGEGGHKGVENINLTPRHSLATDRSIIRTGAVTLFDVSKGKKGSDSCSQTTSMAIAQDTGGAIIGAHVDWFQGDGEKAGAMADAMNNPGTVYVAVPKREGKGCD